MRTPLLILALVAGSLLSACASREEPARQVITSAEAAIEESRTEAQQYAPEHLQAAESALEEVRRKFAAKEYREVLDDAPRLNESIAVMRQAVVGTQTAMAAATREWEELSTEVPKLVQAIERRVATLPRQKQRDVQAELENLKTEWQAATAEFDAGHPLEAADKARSVQTKAREVEQRLG